MNVVHYAKLNYRLRYGACARFVGSFLVFSFLTGCSSSGSTGMTSTPDVSFSTLKNAIVRLRGLSLIQDIKLELATTDAAAGAQDQTLAELYSPETVTQVATVYERIGLLSESTDFAKASASYHRLDHLTSYDSQSATVVLRPEAARLGQAFSETHASITREIPATFGIIQALQEQHFQWQEKIQFAAMDDQKLTFRALAKGDATLLALALANGDQPPAASPATAETLGRVASAVEKLGSDLPELFRRKLVFPYRDGSQFVLWALVSKGWDGVNALFSDPPLSTSQILHPEKYYVQRENPLRIFPWGLARQMKESAILEQTLGEYLIRLLLSAARSEGEASQIAAAWQGDLLSAYPESDGLVTAWISSWKTEKDARDFLQAYAAVLEKLHNIRFEPSSGENNSLHTQLSNGQAMVLDLHGPMVLLLDGMPFARAREVAQETWKDLETGRESIAIPFDLANRTPQSVEKRR